MDSEFSIDFLIRLSNCKSTNLRCKAASNPKTPFEILIRLSEDKDEDVRDCAKRNRMNRLNLLK